VKKASCTEVEGRAENISLEQRGIHVFVSLGLLESMNIKVVYGSRRLYI
jgi:hypothetical protein